jgi:hypothetical protein
MADNNLIEEYKKKVNAIWSNIKWSDKVFDSKLILSLEQYFKRNETNELKYIFSEDKEILNTIELLEIIFKMEEEINFPTELFINWNDENINSINLFLDEFLKECQKYNNTVEILINNPIHKTNLLKIEKIANLCQYVVRRLSLKALKIVYNLLKEKDAFFEFGHGDIKLIKFIHDIINIGISEEEIYSNKDVFIELFDMIDERPNFTSELRYLIYAVGQEKSLKPFIYYLKINDDKKDDYLNILEYTNSDLALEIVSSNSLPKGIFDFDIDIIKLLLEQHNKSILVEDLKRFEFSYLSNDKSTNYSKLSVEEKINKIHKTFKQDAVNILKDNIDLFSTENGEPNSLSKKLWKLINKNTIYAQIISKLFDFSYGKTEGGMFFIWNLFIRSFPNPEQSQIEKFLNNIKEHLGQIEDIIKSNFIKETIIMVNDLIIKSIEQIVPTIIKANKISKHFHDETSLSEEEIANYGKWMLKNNMDIDSDTVQKAATIMGSGNLTEDSIDSIKKYDAFLKKFNPSDSAEKLINSIKLIIDKWNSGKISNSDSRLVQWTLSKIKMIQQASTIEEYIDKIEPKVKKLFNLNYSLPNGFTFEVLNDGNIEHFQVGEKTDCCQRLGGAGEEAAIDSFINGKAGVLVLRDPNNNIISQSYFHYVPEDNGYILDNVEENVKLVKQYNLNLNAIYASLAQQVKKDFNVNYFKCGKGYNKLDNNFFQNSKLEEDPRYFAIDQYIDDDPYSDFDEEDHIDLLAPQEKFELIPMQKDIAKAAYISNKLFKLAKYYEEFILSSFK